GLAEAHDRSLGRTLGDFHDLEGLVLDRIRDGQINAEAFQGVPPARLLIGHHPGNCPPQDEVGPPRIVRPDPAHPARGAAALVSGSVLLEHDAPLARDDRLLRVHDDDLFAVQESFREDGGQPAHDVPGRIDRRHCHPMIRTPDPFGFWVASSRRVMARPPAASIFFWAAMDVRNAATVTGVVISPVAKTTPGTTICWPF